METDEYTIDDFSDYSIPNMDMVDTVIIKPSFVEIFPSETVFTWDAVNPILPFKQAVVRIALAPDANTEFYYEKHKESHILGRHLEENTWALSIFKYHEVDEIESYGAALIERDKNTGIWVSSKLPPDFLLKDEYRDSALRDLNTVFGLFHLISRVRDYQNLRRPIRKSNPVIAKQKNGKIKKTNYKKICFGVYTFDETVEKQIVREFTTPSWTTRGHYRYYKSGKKVWIEPYVCCRAKDLLSPRAFEKRSILSL